MYFEDGGRIQQVQVAFRSWKGKETNFPLRASRGKVPIERSFVPVGPISAFDLKNCKINLVCLELPSLQEFLIAE